MSGTNIKNNTFVVQARFNTITNAGTYTSVLDTTPVLPAGAIITKLVVRERTALAGGTSYQFVVDSISGTSDTNLTGAVLLASFTGLNNLMGTASTGVEATMTSAGNTAVVETGILKLVTVGTTSAGDIDVVVEYSIAP